MPKRRGTAGQNSNAPVRKCRKRVEAKSLDIGTPLVDIKGKHWVLGEAFARGGFGTIHEICPQGSNSSFASSFVCKIEPKSNGPMFCEIHFYARLNVPRAMDQFMRDKTIVHLGMPVVHGYGQTETHRFLIMDRYGANLEKSKLSLANIMRLACQMLYTLEYIHLNGYAHNDLKASNIVFDRHNSGRAYLIDYGLVSRFMSSSNGEHIAMAVRPQSRHDGTVEYTSLDAHKGVQGSRRSDLEVFLYNCVEWLSCEPLPWKTCLSQPEKIQEMKEEFKAQPTAWLRQRVKLVSSACLPDVSGLASYIFSLDYAQKPDYDRCRSYIIGALNRVDHRNVNGRFDGQLVLSQQTAEGSVAEERNPSATNQRVAHSIRRRRNKLPVDRGLQTD